jgi:hypothetical protein
VPIGDQDTAERVYLAEYASLKEEQRARIGFRDNLLYVTIASMAAVIAVVTQSHDPAGLLLLPPISIALGCTYLVNDQKISAISDYVRDELSPRVAALMGEGGRFPVFGWETAHRGDPHRTSRKVFQLVVDCIAFCVAPIAALVLFWCLQARMGAPAAVSFAELAAVAVLGWQIVVHADLTVERESLKSKTQPAVQTLPATESGADRFAAPGAGDGGRGANAADRRAAPSIDPAERHA